MSDPDTWEDFVDWEAVEAHGGLVEDELWQAIADANDLDYNEIADGDILEWI